MRRSRIAVIAALTAVGLTATSLAGSAAAGIAPDGAIYAKLRGSNVVGPQGQSGVGDPDGYGSFTAIPVGNRFCGGFAVINLNAVIHAGIYRGIPGQNGSLVTTLPLAFPASAVGHSAGCTSAYGGAQAYEGRWYVLIRTGPFPNGALRGQVYGG